MEGIVDTWSLLDEAIASARSADYLTVDTEFVWQRTYYPHLGLVQLGWDHHAIAVDVVSLDCGEEIGALLADGAIQKLLHDAPQDLSILYRLTGALPNNVFDTQRAAGFVGYGMHASLASMVETVCGITMDKSETRSDWLQRPLTEAQITYALEDVRYLEPIRSHILTKAERSSVVDWLWEEMATIGTPENLAERSDDERFYKFKGLSHLKPRAQAIVREVLSWRTERARELDLPIRNVLSDEAVRDIAIRTPRYLGALAEIKGVPRSVVGRFGNELIDLVDAVELPNEPLVRRGRRHPLDDLVKDTTQHVREYVRVVSEDRGIDPIMVCTRTDVERWVRKGGKTKAPFLEGWRGAFIGDAVQAMIPSDLADLDL